MDKSSIEVRKISWLAGVGIRLTPAGCLYNVWFGNAIRITSFSGGKIFLVGTNDGITIMKLLQERPI